LAYQWFISEDGPNAAARELPDGFGAAYLGPSRGFST
jgi:hypothetical protein